MKKMTSIFLSILIIISIIISLLFTMPNKKIPQELNEVKLGNEIIKLEKYDYLSASYYNTAKTKYKYKNYKTFPILYGGITINSKVDDLLDKFEIEEGSALIKGTVKAKKDYSYINEEYKNDFFLNYKDKYDEVTLTFGYKNNDNTNTYEKLTNKELMGYCYDCIIYDITISGENKANINKDSIIEIYVNTR